MQTIRAISKATAGDGASPRIFRRRLAPSWSSRAQRPRSSLPMERPLFSPPWKRFIATKYFGRSRGRLFLPTIVLYEQDLNNASTYGTGDALIRRALQTAADFAGRDSSSRVPLETRLGRDRGLPEPGRRQIARRSIDVRAQADPRVDRRPRLPAPSQPCAGGVFEMNQGSRLRSASVLACSITSPRLATTMSARHAPP